MNDGQNRQLEETGKVMQFQLQILWSGYEPWNNC